MSDDTPDTYDLDEMFDWLCWVIGSDASDIYPPTEADVSASTEQTARCGAENDIYNFAVSTFAKLYVEGFDPKARAQRHRIEYELDLQPIDWTWLTESTLETELIEYTEDIEIDD